MVTPNSANTLIYNDSKVSQSLNHAHLKLVLLAPSTIKVRMKSWIHQTDHCNGETLSTKKSDCISAYQTR